ncbi:uncharacterized protein LOC114198865 [Eumetopias jubatus]|uniref:uncharacterized protein LOC114198865 n=1 Tax=Eumetopias jubatus TaxID=34886 RepID=UPI0010160701|nr:uncharacterized protein LOC114198865 [Eumetopias jubatus]
MGSVEARAAQPALQRELSTALGSLCSQPQQRRLRHSAETETSGGGARTGSDRQAAERQGYARKAAGKQGYVLFHGIDSKDQEMESQTKRRGCFRLDRNKLRAKALKTGGRRVGDRRKALQELLALISATLVGSCCC